MASISTTRVNRELQNFNTDSNQEIQVEVVGDNIRHLQKFLVKGWKNKKNRILVLNEKFKSHRPLHFSTFVSHKEQSKARPIPNTRAATSNSTLKSPTSTRFSLQK